METCVFIPIARAEFTIAPLLKVRFPPLREGNRVGRVGSVPPACRGNLKEGVRDRLAFLLPRHPTH
jgi:hypothetical protein